MFPLPEAQLERFLVKIETGYTSTKGFKEMLKRIERVEDFVEDLKPLLTKEDVITATTEASGVGVEDSIYDYIVSIVEETRKHPAVKLGVHRWLG